MGLESYSPGHNCPLSSANASFSSSSPSDVSAVSLTRVRGRAAVAKQSGAHSTVSYTRGGLKISQFSLLCICNGCTVVPPWLVCGITLDVLWIHSGLTRVLTPPPFHHQVMPKVLENTVLLRQTKNYKNLETPGSGLTRSLREVIFF